MNLTKIINLGMHPYADTFVPEQFFAKSEPVHPLQCGLDEETGHVMLMYLTDPVERYNLYPYSYTSSNSKIAKNHWVDFASSTHQKLGLKEEDFVVEIGSNDGFLTAEYMKLGCEALGIDPSHSMAVEAAKLGVTTKCTVFCEASSHKVEKKATLVVANNVFNHANDPIDFALGVRNILKDEGTFVFQVPYWLNTIKDRKFDQIYHEHPSYFTVKSARNLLKKAGLYVYDVEWYDYHGGSIRVFASRQEREVTQAVKDHIAQEEEEGLFTLERYESFMSDISHERNTFLSKLYALKTEGKSIVAIGAAAKGNTFLNYYNLDRSVIDYVTDMSDHKVGKYTPLSRIPIDTDDEVFSQYEDVYAIVLSWNISDLIKSKLKDINPNITFIQ